MAGRRSFPRTSRGARPFASTSSCLPYRSSAKRRERVLGRVMQRHRATPSRRGAAGPALTRSRRRRKIPDGPGENTILSSDHQWGESAMTHGRARVARRAASVLGILGVGVALVLPAAGAPSAGAATLPRPEGAGPPVPASGVGTQAALDNPRCRHTTRNTGRTAASTAPRSAAGPCASRSGRPARTTGAPPRRA